ncbi:hypothetical protein [Vibrio splendidus]|nr:hypothetical protein [Vibrio splendidus]
MKTTNITRKECNRLRLANAVNHIDFTFEEALAEGERVIKKKIESLEFLFERSNEEYDELAYDSDGYMVDSPEVESILADISNYEYDIEMNKEQLYCFSEMKIIHLFKAYEVTMKRIVKTAYPTANERDFFNWEKLITFSRVRGVALKKLEGFDEVNQLRVVNNNIKHSAGVSSEVIRHVPFFSESRYFTLESLNEFYLTVRDCIFPFLQAMAFEFDKAVFEQSDEKLDKIVAEYSKVMSSSELKMLSEKLRVMSEQDDNVSILDYLKAVAITRERT